MRPQRLEAQSLSQPDVSRVGANRVEARIAGEVDERRIALLTCLIEERERFIELPQANVRQMLGRSGEAWGAESGLDRLVMVPAP